MTTTQISQNIRPNHVAAVVERDGETIGRVVCKGPRSFAASRKVGTATDIRRYATNFHTVEAAAKWVAA